MRRSKLLGLIVELGFTCRRTSVVSKKYLSKSVRLELAEGLTTNVFLGQLFASLLLISFLWAVSPTYAQNIEELKKGVVKITTQADGKTKVGTGFIARLEKDAVYVVTASHVVEGDPEPKVVFRGKESKSFSAQVKGMKGGDPRGVAVLVMAGNLPQGIEALPVSTDFETSGGEAVTVIGFPRTPAVPWAVTPGVVTGQDGEYLVFSGAAAEGNSGGPVLFNGKVIGVVTEVLSQYGYAVPISILRLALRGWGISLEAASNETKQLSEEKDAQDILPREITGMDGAPMVLVPAGEFIMGLSEDAPILFANKEDRPAHPVYLGAYYIDQYEVTNAHYATFLIVTERPEPKYWSEQVLIEHRRKPVIGVDWNDAAAYCAWVGKRLPTEAEWEKAARGTDQRLYPWGNAAPDEQRTSYHGGEKFEFHVLTDVGSFPQGRSPYGAYDMAGNVWEWTADWYDETYYSKSPKRNPKGPSSGQYRVFRGGSWGSDFVRSVDRHGGEPTGRGGDLGFRCARDIPK